MRNSSFVFGKTNKIPKLFEYTRYTVMLVKENGE